MYLGLCGDLLLATEPRGAAKPLAQRLPTRSTLVLFNGVYLTEQRQGPINVLAW